MKKFHSKKDLLVNLSQTEKNFILSTFPKGTSVQESHYFDNYDLPCPIKIKVTTPKKETKFVVLRKTRHGNKNDLKLETQILTLLTKYNLPVPKVLAGPKNSMLLLSLLEGENLQHLSMKSKSHAQKTRKLLLNALTVLENITEKINRDAGKILPHYSLIDELKPIQNKAPWNSEKIFKKAIEHLLPILHRISTPLIFTNGDYQPANFLTDGKKITGFLDFENAQLRDPLMGLTKYPVYDLHPLNKAGFVNIYLKGRGFTEKQFLPRLALFCLITLQKEIPIHPTNQKEKKYQKRVLDLLKHSLNEISNNPVYID